MVEGVRVKDRGVYRCRVDFQIQPTTISRVDLSVNMPPEKPVILDSRGREVGRRLGPFRLGQTLVVSCSALGGRPSPSVTWWRESQVVDTSFEREEARVTNTLTIPNLSRKHLHTILTCQASNSNASLPVSTSVKLDLTFPPTEVVIKGADLPLSSGKSHRQELARMLIEFFVGCMNAAAVACIFSSFEDHSVFHPNLFFSLQQCLPNG